MRGSCLLAWVKIKCNGSFDSKTLKQKLDTNRTVYVAFVPNRYVSQQYTALRAEFKEVKVKLCFFLTIMSLLFVFRFHSKTLKLPGVSVRFRIGIPFGIRFSDGLGALQIVCYPKYLRN